MLEKKIKLIIIILIIAIVLIATTGTVVFFTTDLLKSKDTLFKKYLAQNIKNIAEVTEISEEEKNIDTLLKNNYTENSDITLKYLKSENDEEEVYNIKKEGIINNEKKNSYRDIQATFNGEQLINVKALREDDTFGFRLANIVEQYVNVKNASVAYLISSLGYDGKYFPEKFNLDEIELSGLLDFTDEELKELTEKYSKIIFEDIDAKDYSATSNAIITLNNGESVTTKAYTLTLNKNQIDKIYKKTLNQAKEDKIILAKLDKIDERIKIIGFNEPEGESLKEKYIAKIQEKIDSIEYEGEDNRKIIFSVYQSKGVTLRTSMKTEEFEYIIDLDNKAQKTMSLKNIKYTEDGTDEKTYSIGKQKTEEGNKRVLKYNDSKKALEVSINMGKQDETLSISADLNYKSYEIYNMDVNLNTDINIGKKDVIPTTFESNKVILINNYEDGDTIRSIFNQLKHIEIKSLEEIQSKINTKLLNSIINWINEREEKIARELQDNTELQKQRFNNQFELYKGENLKFEHVQKLLSVVSNNFVDYEVVNSKKIKLNLKKGEHNDEKINQVKNAITDGHTYNVDISYAEDGYVNSIDITIYVDK